MTNLPELLERSGLEHRCLFKGDAYDELKNVAPWIVRLEEGSAFTRNLFTRSDASWHLWEREPGIYFRSRGALDEMWRHFRKFTRVQDKDQQWFYWRFWDVETVPIFLEKAAWPKNLPYLVGDAVFSITLIRSKGPVEVIKENRLPTQGVGLSFKDVSILSIREKKISELRKYFCDLTPRRFRAIGKNQQENFLRHLMVRSEKLRITKYSEIAYLGCLMQAFGCWFDVDPSYYRINRFITDPEYNENPHRVDLLHQERENYLKSCVGEDGEIRLRHQRNIMVRLSALHGGYEVMNRTMIADMIRRDTPEKFTFLGREAVSKLFVESERLSREMGFLKEWHTASIAALAYALGVGFFNDPFYPWVRQKLFDRGSDADDRMMCVMQYAEKRLRKSVMEAEKNVR